MRRAIGAVLLAMLALAAAPAPQPADLVFTRGAVYTVDGARSWAEAVAVADGRIVFAGTDADAKPWIGPKTKVLDLGGKMLLPAFHDAHVHPVSGGVEALECDLNGLSTQVAILQKVKRYAAEHAAAPWVTGPMGGRYSPKAFTRNTAICPRVLGLCGQ